MVVWWTVPPGRVTVPARDGVQSLLWPLVPALLAVAVPTSLSSAYREGELTAARSALQLRMTAMVSVALLSLGISLVGLRFDILVIWRNSLFLMGLALLATAIQPPTTAWIPVCGAPIAMWLLGPGYDETISAWAVLLHPRTSAIAWTSSIGVFALGAAAYLWFRLPWASARPRGVR